MYLRFLKVLHMLTGKVEQKLKIQCVASIVFRTCKGWFISLKAKVFPVCETRMRVLFREACKERSLWLPPAGQRFCFMLFHFWHNGICRGCSYCFWAWCPADVTVRFICGPVLHSRSFPLVTSPFLLPQHFCPPCSPVFDQMLVLCASSVLTNSLVLSVLDVSIVYSWRCGRITER